MRKVKKENDSETQHANFWKPNGALGFTCGFGCSSIASDKKYPSKNTRSYKKNRLLQYRERQEIRRNTLSNTPSKNTRSYKKKLTSPILLPLKHGA